MQVYVLKVETGASSQGAFATLEEAKATLLKNWANLNNVGDPIWEHVHKNYWKCTNYNGTFCDIVCHEVGTMSWA